MKNTTTYNEVNTKHFLLKEVGVLVKFKLSSLVVFTAAMGYLIAAGASFNFVNFILLCIGGFGVTFAANALNQVIERDFDRQMARTSSRPLVTGSIKISEGVFLAGMFCLVGVTALSAIHPLTGVLGMLSMILYAFLYTPMKRYSTMSIWVGGIPGALPILIGAVAAEGHISGLALVLFAIQYFWQLPHFWSIGYLSFEDYKGAGFKVVPTGKNGDIDTRIGLYSSLVCVLMIIIIAYAGYVSMINPIELLSGIVITALYLVASINLQIHSDRASARKLMFSSFMYMPLFLALILIF